MTKPINKSLVLVFPFGDNPIIEECAKALEDVSSIYFHWEKDTVRNLVDNKELTLSTEMYEWIVMFDSTHALVLHFDDESDYNQFRIDEALMEIYSNFINKIVASRGGHVKSITLHNTNNAVEKVLNF